MCLIYPLKWKFKLNIICQWFKSEDGTNYILGINCQILFTFYLKFAAIFEMNVFEMFLETPIPISWKISYFTLGRVDWKLIDWLISINSIEGKRLNTGRTWCPTTKGTQGFCLWSTISGLLVEFLIRQLLRISLRMIIRKCCHSPKPASQFHRRSADALGPEILCLTDNVH